MLRPALWIAGCCTSFALAFAWSGAQDSGAAPAGAAALPERIWQETRILTPIELVAGAEFQPSEPQSLVLGLHGFGHSAQGFRRVAERMVEFGHLVALPEGPYPMLVGGDHLGFDWSLYHLGDEALEERAVRLVCLEQLPDAVREVRTRYPTERVHLLGFSQGAVAALLTGITHPDLVDGVITFGLPGFDPDWFDEGVFDAGRGVRVLLIHGEQDDRAALSITRKAASQLREAGYEVTEEVFQGGHVVPDALLDLASDWILEGPVRDPGSDR